MGQWRLNSGFSFVCEVLGEAFDPELFCWEVHKVQVQAVDVE